MIIINNNNKKYIDNFYFDKLKVEIVKNLK